MTNESLTKREAELNIINAARKLRITIRSPQHLTWIRKIDMPEYKTYADARLDLVGLYVNEVGKDIPSIEFLSLNVELIGVYAKASNTINHVLRKFTDKQVDQLISDEQLISLGLMPLEGYGVTS